jgi:hypothetical protein
MGLDASVDVLVKDLGDPDLISEAKRKGLKSSDDIGLRVGSYSALHYLRDFYGIVYQDVNGRGVEVEATHLLNHSDCEGYYLPERFEKPVWIDDSERGVKSAVSIGSTSKLLQELEWIRPYVEWLPPEEIAVTPEERAMASDYAVVRHVFDVMYFLARVSMDVYRPIIFH